MRRDVKEQERYNKHWKLSMRRRVKYKSASHHSMSGFTQVWVRDIANTD